MPEQRFEDGDIIFKEGDKVGSAYLIESGRVRISKAIARRGADDEEIELEQVGPGSMFGEMALIDELPRMAKATAIGPTVCSTTDATWMHRKLALLDPEALAFYREMMTYIRENLPYEARPDSIKKIGNTQADRAARAMLARLPTVVAAIKHPPPIMITVFELFGHYIRRRLPPG